MLFPHSMATVNDRKMTTRLFTNNNNNFRLMFGIEDSHTRTTCTLKGLIIIRKGYKML